VSASPVNDTIPGNVCFGCGPGNAAGLGIEIFRDPESPGRLLGRFEARPEQAGFPGITHGGALYAALDCMATWSGMLLADTRALWVLRSASMRYLRPALAGRPLALSAEIEKAAGAWEPIVVRCEARDADGVLLARGSFDVVPLPPEKFLAITGLSELPEGWARWLAGEG